MTNTTVFDFTMTSIDGVQIPLSKFKGKKILIVNTASECGQTPQYAMLEELHQKYGSKIHVLGFPANEFGSQEPGTNEEIKGFCTKNYGVTFPMFAKIVVKGEGAHPLYKWLKEISGEEPNWNFAKYLVSEDGSKVNFVPVLVGAMDESIISQL